MLKHGLGDVTPLGRLNLWLWSELTPRTAVAVAAPLYAQIAALWLRLCTLLVISESRHKEST